ncbi:hypothetical protein ABPG77_003429 [Micractinium sp. CCAP 211/92]
MSSWPGQPLATEGAGALPLQPSSPRHYVLPPPANAPQAPEQLVPVPETGLVDVMLCSHRQAFILFDHAVKAVAQGNTHTMELVSGSLAVDLRLHAQAVTDVLCPLLQRRYGAWGASVVAALRQQLQAIERDVLEMLTFRREHNWPALAERVNLMHKASPLGWIMLWCACLQSSTKATVDAAQRICAHCPFQPLSRGHGCTDPYISQGLSSSVVQDYASYVHDVEVTVLPRLAADMAPEELVSSALLFQQHKQTASLVPQTGDDAFAAAARAGPDVATVLGGPIMAGSYQAHTHAHAHGSHKQRQQAVAAAAPSKAAAPLMAVRMDLEP